MQNSLTRSLSFKYGKNSLMRLNSAEFMNIDTLENLSMCRHLICTIDDINNLEETLQEINKIKIDKLFVILNIPNIELKKNIIQNIKSTLKHKDLYLYTVTNENDWRLIQTSIDKTLLGFDVCDNSVYLLLFVFFLVLFVSVLLRLLIKDYFN